MSQPVIFITDSLSRKRGGAEIYMANLAEFLARNGRPVRALVRRDCADFSAAGVEVEILRTRGHGLRREKDFEREVQKRLQGNHSVVLSTIALPGVTHYQPHMGLQRRGILASRESRDTGFSRWLHRLGNSFNLKRRRLLKMQEQSFARDSTTRVMVFSKLVRGQILEDYGLPPENVTVAPLGVDLNRFRPDENFPKRDAEKLKLLFVAHNYQLKGLHCLLTAMSRAAQEGLKAELQIVGNGPRAPFEKLAAKLGLSARVRFLGVVDDDGAAALYRSSDVLVHPTFTDHCSLVVLEALASGLPVITTRQNGACEFIEQGKQGIILDHPRDIEALSDALVQLQDRSKLASMSAAAAALRPKLDFNNHARQVLEWLTANDNRRAT
jgi:UDP-glucose:(heptosyl)LPS alpha-1,3-glucosyltransferase